MSIKEGKLEKLPSRLLQRAAMVLKEISKHWSLIFCINILHSFHSIHFILYTTSVQHNCWWKKIWKHKPLSCTNKESAHKFILKSRIIQEIYGRKRLICTSQSENYVTARRRILQKSAAWRDELKKANRENRPRVSRRISRRRRWTK